MEALSVRLLGGFRVGNGTTNLPSIEVGKSQELFCFLLLHRNRPHAREMLAGLLWSDHPTAIARKNLRQALWNLQSVLSMYPDIEVQRFLHVTTDVISLDASSWIWLDVAILEEAYGCVRGIAGEGLTEGQATALKAAVTLYDGDLLEGWYQDWCIHAREAVQQAYLTMLDKLMAYAEARAAFEDGIVYGDRILRCDPARERTHRRLMRLHCLAGDRTAALRQFDRCVRTLERELGVSPARSTLALVEEIRADRFAVASTSPLPPAHLPQQVHLVQRLRDVQAHLMALHDQLQHDIRSLEDS